MAAEMEEQKKQEKAKMKNEVIQGAETTLNNEFKEQL